jgi:hypothetical protein
MLRITLFPSSRLGRLIYMVGAILVAFAFLGEAWRDTRTEKAFAQHGAVADVLPVDHYIQHSSRSSTTNVTRETYKSADLSFRTPDDRRYTRTMQLEESEFQTLKDGGTLHMQYLPEDPQGSARLEGRRQESWIGWVLATLFGLYAFALKP